jgi:steroid 5-alpha reductase family enzyme
MLALLLVGTLVVCTLQLLLWLIHLRMKNASFVDPGWAASLAILGALYAWQGDGWITRRWMLAIMTGIWGWRLSLYLLVRILGHPEEGRYTELRRKWGANIEFKFLIFFLAQALLAVALSLPFLAPVLNEATQIHWLEIAAAAIWIISIAGEAIADQQLHRFKQNSKNQGKTCREGLWRYSRHPNYFFEWLIWVAYALFSLASPGGWIGVASPLLMLYFLFRVTGIPATEEQSIRSRGDDYRRYIEETSAFVPWFPKRKADAGLAQGSSHG